ncbi:MalM family protein [Hahella aquimaris]|uniref:MalM family protein n=1 Tax=Hahella sp. HNIBRBA332 TaxID=3015983 RepID=UPI00273C67EE|nr:MalM family protein [Hahella sp. HNIBRBA332]WLQ15300.1 MalM family protein [Hahella sp. HNIBRBA332]
MKKTALLLSLALFSSGSVLADRYYTWVDENGQVRHTLIRDGQPAASPQAQQQTLPEAAQSTPEQSPTSTEAAAPPVEKEINAEATSSSQAQEVSVANDVQEVSKADSPQPASPVSQSKSSQREIIDESTYIDAAELEKRGFVREGDSRFYTWVDTNGVMHTEEYNPADAKSKAHVQPLQPTQVVADEQRIEKASLPEGADPFAADLLGLNAPGAKQEIDLIYERCCENLVNDERVELEFDDGELLEIHKDEQGYNFGVGYSLYRVVEIPEGSVNRLLQLRAYAQPDAFYPSVLVLDSAWKPVRFLQDLLYIYEPENWFRYGYLEGFLRVKTKDEKYLVLLTTGADLKKRTVAEGVADKPVVISHSASGILHLAILPPE